MGEIKALHWSRIPRETEVGLNVRVGAWPDLWAGPLLPCRRDKKVGTSTDIEKCVGRDPGSWEFITNVFFYFIWARKQTICWEKHIGRELGALSAANLQSSVWDQCLPSSWAGRGLSKYAVRGPSGQCWWRNIISWSVKKAMAYKLWEQSISQHYLSLSSNWDEMPFTLVNHKQVWSSSKGTFNRKFVGEGKEHRSEQPSRI